MDDEVLSSSPPSHLFSLAEEVVNHLVSKVGIRSIAFDFDQTMLKIHTGGVWEGSVEDLLSTTCYCEEEQKLPSLVANSDESVIRPEIRALMEAIDAHNNRRRQKEQQKITKSNSTTTIAMAVVTFTRQISLVRGVLQTILPQSYKNIPIRGSDRSWYVPTRSRGWWKDESSGFGSTVNDDLGKQPHMLSAFLQFQNEYQEKEKAKNMEATTITTTTTTNNNSSALIEEDCWSLSKSSTLLIDDDEFNVQVALMNGVRGVVLDTKNPGTLFSCLLALK